MSIEKVQNQKQFKSNLNETAKVNPNTKSKDK